MPLVCAPLALLVMACGAASGADEPSLTVEIVASGLEEPVAMAFAPDGSLFFNERPGRVRFVGADGRLRPEPVLTLSPALEGEWGLLGLALDPDFERNGHLYVLYTEPVREAVARPTIARYTVADGRATEPVSIARLAETTPPFVIHVGGNLRFGPDGRLYVTVGDYGREPEMAQNLSVPVGKILRLDPDGSVPPDNPFDADDGVDPRIWAYGLRNNWDFDFAPDGSLWSSGNGDDRCDHVNLIVRAGNYGWPRIPDGTCAPEEGLAPKYLLSRGGEAASEPGSTVGPTGLLAYSGTARADWAGDLFVCAVNTGNLTRLDREPADGQRLLRAEVLLPGRCFLDVEEAPDGSLYFSDFEAIYRLEPRG
jgi:glucose/arabinose dehydrogenase